MQAYSDRQYEKRTLNYCQYELTQEVIPVLKKLSPEGLVVGCTDFMFEWDINSDNKSFDYLAYKAQITPSEQKLLTDELKRFNAIVLNDPLTVEWWHDPLNSEVSQYITSSFLHADWEHLFFNLVFFFAFSLVIEQLLGSAIYLLFFTLCCIATGISYESNLFGVYSHLPTLGLSGVVMGLMTLTACIYPFKRMAVFVWFLIVLTTIRVPVILLVSFYVLSDIYGIAYLIGENNVNYVAHLAGSAMGIAFALLVCLYNHVFRSKESAAKSECEGGA
ncbi:rhomboid family intramembrane serine protease [Microbulbifer sp. JTAC008]|uniref:rhomboid family intramembrane serine protease n=1 Tax=unclassified Microbulbifer TaxID=2619833 RepID=UPI00403A0ABA